MGEEAGDARSSSTQTLPLAAAAANSAAVLKPGDTLTPVGLQRAAKDDRGLAAPVTTVDKLRVQGARLGDAAH